MAELTFKSAGVSTREIDLSQPTSTGPIGIPAGIIGTAVQGPAFVPLTFGNYSDFAGTFGQSDGEKFGPLAVQQWLANSQAVTYVRVLGAGDGLKRNTTTGNVTNAGFVVGEKTIQEIGTNTGKLEDNYYAKSGVGETAGRTYFLGCFMSESNGSTIFSESGIQSPSARLSQIEGGLTGSNTWTSAGINGHAVILSDGILAFTGTISNSVNQADSTLTTIGVGDKTQGNGSELAEAIKFWSDLTVGAGNTMDVAISSNIITYTAKRTEFLDANGRLGVGGYRVAGDGGSGTHFSHNSGFTRDADGGAVPILRGVLLAPSGVVLHLSGNNSVLNSPIKGQTARETATSTNGRHGDITGSLTLSSQEFVMLMNGYNNTDSSKKTFITASFDSTSPKYFANVFNTDPLKIEEEGHLLYGHFDISSNLATVTGSGGITDGAFSLGGTLDQEDIVFLLPGIGGRNSSTSTTVNYEDFQDRFRHASTPWVISQKFGTNKKLFKIHLLSDGENVSNKFKFSIENIRRSNSTVEKYGTFDLIIRDFNDTDEVPRVLESFRGISLDPNSDRFVGRVIGDQHVYFNFDVASESQKVIVDGTYPVKSRYIRVELEETVSNGTIEPTALPFGFKGIKHLNISGSYLSAPVTSSYVTNDYLQRVVEPPVPYRNTIAVNSGIQKRSNPSFYWGIQNTRKTSVTLPNKQESLEKSLQTYTKHFPEHKLDSVKFFEGDNDAADSYNNNKFSLEHIKVRTGSDGLADVEQWLSASYVRDGNVGIDHTLKTRAFKPEDLGNVGNIRFAKFTFIAQGGFDGVNIFNSKKSKLENIAIQREIANDENSQDVKNNTVAAYRKAVDIVSSKADVDIQLLAVPGVRDPSVTDYAISKIEDRFDAMYIMDIEERDQFNTVITSSVQKPHVGYTVNQLKNRALDSSFAAAYFPDVVIQDGSTRTLVQVPPSVAVLGAYSLNDKLAHPWYAPAGFSRGALNTVEVPSVKLNRANLDDLYEADINPIAEFPGVGITIWGQKTLQAANSALDRVNVRRLLIDVRRKVKAIANTLLFEPNREETLEKFSSLVNPILQKIQEQSGVERYKAVIDTSTTTQADVENNTIRGKIYLQPTRSVEFVALDFVVTNAGSNI